MSLVRAHRTRLPIFQHSAKPEKRWEFLTGYAEVCSYMASHAIRIQCIMEIGIVDVLCIHSIHYTNWKSGWNVSSVCLCLNIFIFPAFSLSLCPFLATDSIFRLNAKVKEIYFPFRKHGNGQTEQKNKEEMGMEMVLERRSKSEPFCIQRH